MAARSTTSTETKTTTERLSTPGQTQNVFLGCVGAFVLLLIFGAVVSYLLLSNRDYTLNKDIATPTLESLPKYTNKDFVDVSGRSSEGSRVVLFLDGKESGDAIDTRGNGKFDFEDVELNEEKSYKFKVAQVKVSLFSKERSEFSKTETIIVDRAAPRKEIVLDKVQNEVKTAKINISGKVLEKDVIAVVKNGNKEFEATPDANGRFTVKDVELKKGKNTLEIIVRDLAGNETKVRTIVVTLDEGATSGGTGSTTGGTTGGNINGNGASTTTGGLPSSAGETEVAQVVLIGGVVGILAMLAALAGGMFMSVKESLRKA